MSHIADVLVIEDQENMQDSCEKVLSKEGCSVELAESGDKGLQFIRQKSFDLAIIDLKLPGISGMKVLEEIGEKSPDTIAIVITGYATVESAVKAMKLGAYDFLPKPFTPDELRIIIRRALEKKRLLIENRALRQELQSRYKFGNIIGKSKKMKEVYKTIEKVAPTDSTVLIYGESGTGKELVARSIHYNSPRRKKQFVSIDCGALSEHLLESELFGHVKGSFTGAVVAKPGLFQVANGGTIFLDEIGDISLGIQAKLLRVLQEREFKQVGGTENIKVDIRLIAATNKNLEDMIDKEKFREDLFYRLNIVPIILPPLRDRKEDIPLLAQNFLKKYNKERNKNIKGISSEAMSLFTEYHWSGNVRELENIIERLVVMIDEQMIGPKHLPANIRKTMPSISVEVPQNSHQLKELKKRTRNKAIEDLERSFITEALKRNNGNVSKSAKDVGMKRQNFQSLMRKYNITSK